MAGIMADGQDVQKNMLFCSKKEVPEKIAIAGTFMQTIRTKGFGCASRLNYVGRHTTAHSVTLGV